jgi:hypothetical protein
LFGFGVFFAGKAGTMTALLFSLANNIAGCSAILMKNHHFWPIGRI